MLEVLLERGLQEAPVFAGTENEMTLGKLRMTIAGTSENLAIDEAVSRLREQLKKELNLLDSDFVMLPALFQRGMAVIPNAVNSVVVNGHLLVPGPRGPRHDEKDAFEEAIRAALAGCDVRVVFIESWNAYHTSARRDPLRHEHLPPPARPGVVDVRRQSGREGQLSQRPR